MGRNPDDSACCTLFWLLAAFHLLTVFGRALRPQHYGAWVTLPASGPSKKGEHSTAGWRLASQRGASSQPANNPLHEAASSLLRPGNGPVIIPGGRRLQKSGRLKLSPMWIPILAANTIKVIPALTFRFWIKSFGIIPDPFSSLKLLQTCLKLWLIIIGVLCLLKFLSASRAPSQVCQVRRRRPNDQLGFVGKKLACFPEIGPPPLSQLPMPHKNTKKLPIISAPKMPQRKQNVSEFAAWNRIT